MMSESTAPGMAMAYLLLLVPICYLAWRKSNRRNPEEHYLAGHSLGPFVLVLTLFATAQSSNTMMAFPAEAWRQGFVWVMAFSIPTGLLMSYHLIVPALRRYASDYHLVTPGDWIDCRFAGQTGCYPLKLLVSLVMLLVSANILFAQLKAMGEATEALTGGFLSYQQGVIAMAVIVTAYDLAGGMRAVAWTDALQGILMILGVCLLLAWLGTKLDSLNQLTLAVEAARQGSMKPPALDLCLKWLSLMLLTGLSVIVYPQSIQRYLAARCHKTAFLSMGVFGLLISGIMVAVIFAGLCAIPVLGSSGIAADQVMPLLLAEMSQENSLLAFAAGIIFLALCAAIMSTADSVLLSSISIMRRDLFPSPPGGNPGKEIGLTLTVMALLTGLAMYRDISLWRLLELKLEALLQCFPACVICLYNRRLPASSILAGLITGLMIYLAAILADQRLWLNIHAGLWALAVNIMVCYIAQRYTKI
ncbi:MAG: sodium:solute symporter family protein [Endozoicomonas sp.]